MNTLEITPELETKARAEIKVEDKARSVADAKKKADRDLLHAKWRIRLNDARTPEEKDKVRSDLRGELYEEHDTPFYGYDRATKDLQIILGEYFERPVIDDRKWFFMVAAISISGIIALASIPISLIAFLLSLAVCAVFSVIFYIETHQPLVLRPDE